MPSVAFAVKVPARLPLVPFTRVSMTTPQTSLCCGPASCHPLNEVSLLRFDADLSINAGTRSTRAPGVSPDRTSTGWLP